MDIHVALRPMRAFCSGASDETEAYVNCKLQENNLHLDDIYNGHQLDSRISTRTKTPAPIPTNVLDPSYTPPPGLGEDHPRG